MRSEVSAGIDELRRQFSTAAVIVREDDHGGAYVIIEPVELGSRYRPTTTWLGFHISAQYPYADIYPVFVGESVSRADGAPFAAPITPGHTFEGRPALQISRRNNAAHSAAQKAASKVLKVLDFMERLP